jgi:hypothetical protein
MGKTPPPKYTAQRHFQHHSNCTHHNKKLACLYRLGQQTGNQLFGDLFNRAMQCGFWTQATEGEFAGAQYKRMSDRWKNVSKEFDSKGSRHMNELSLDANLQLLETGLAHAPGATAHQRANSSPKLRWLTLTNKSQHGVAFSGIPTVCTVQQARRASA